MAKAKVVKKGVRSRAYHIMTEVNSALGTPALSLGNDDRFKIVRIPSGSLAIDRITGGGFALGRHYELYGEESSLKSSICYMTMALSQQRGNVCALIDPEHSFNPVWFSHLGGNPEELITAQPEVAEEAIEAMMILFKQGIEVITVDSVAALATKEEAVRKPTDEAKIASQARFMSQNLRRLTTYNERTLVLWINQNRTKIGTFFGNPTSQPGGRALKFYDTARIELRRGQRLTKKAKKANQKQQLIATTVHAGYWVVARAHKNKASREGLEATFLFDSERGEIDEISELMQLGLEDGIIERKNNTFTYYDYDEVEYSGTMKKFRQMLIEDDDLRNEIIQSIEDRTIDLAMPGGSLNGDYTDIGDDGEVDTDD